MSTGSLPWSFSAPLAAAARALVLLDVLCLRRGDPNALAMEPLLADVAADPELTVRVSLSASATHVSLVLILCAFRAAVFLIFWLRWLCRLAVRIGLLRWFRVGLVAFAAAVGDFCLLLGNSRHNFIYSGKTINHGEEPSPGFLIKSKASPKVKCYRQ